MFYSLYKSIQLIEDEYDLIVRTRFDIDYSKFDFILNMLFYFQNAHPFKNPSAFRLLPLAS